MPVVAAYMVYAGAAAATTTTFAGIMAGVMAVGGAVSLVGTLTGDKKLESDGMMVGTIGSLGMNFAGAGAKEAAAGTATETGADLTATGTTPGAPSTLTGEAINSGLGTGTSTASTAQSTQEVAALMTKFDALEKAQNMNMMGNVAQGLSTAYSSNRQATMLQEQEDKRRADQLALIEERRRNMDLTGLKINTPNMPQILKPGLINQPQTVNPVTGSGRTMMQIK